MELSLAFAIFLIIFCAAGLFLLDGSISKIKDKIFSFFNQLK